MTARVLIPQTVVHKWQTLVDILADVMAVPTALIMRAEAPFVHVFVANQSKQNPFAPGDVLKMAGLYCEEVIKTRSRLLVSDARQDIKRETKSGNAYGFVAYLGLPLLLPNGEVFGSLCVCDTKPNAFSLRDTELMQSYKELCEMHLDSLYRQDSQIEQERLKAALNASGMLCQDMSRSFQVAWSRVIKTLGMLPPGEPLTGNLTAARQAMDNMASTLLKLNRVTKFQTRDLVPGKEFPKLDGARRPMKRLAIR